MDPASPACLLRALASAGARAVARGQFSGEPAHLSSPSLITSAGFREGYPLDTHESFHGCQYTSLAFGQRLQAAGILPSRGSVGDCFDNAVAESFFATLKVELLHRQLWPTRAAARLAIFEYVEVWYTRQRRHSTLAYATPAEYEALAQERAIA